jgi:hypothetical protein
MISKEEYIALRTKRNAVRDEFERSSSGYGATGKLLSQVKAMDVQLEAYEREVERRVSMPLSKYPFVDSLPLRKLCQDYLEYIAGPDYHEDNDYDHYIFEAAMTAFYGLEIWEWINKQTNR